MGPVGSTQLSESTTVWTGATYRSRDPKRSFVAGPMGMLEAGLTPNFRRWLEGSRFRGDDFARDDVKGGSFGGRSGPDQEVQRTPVVFVHGNGDAALGSVGGLFNGWQEVLKSFISAGYGPEALYGTTWGPANPKQVLQQSHDRVRVRQVRRFLQAVLEYTGQPRIHVVAHSMGVTLARKAIQGGRLWDQRGSVQLGPSLGHQVESFIGIAGANRGLNVARKNPLVQVWNPINGFFPGVETPAGLWVQSRYLRDINRRLAEARRVYSIWSHADGVVDVSVAGEPSGRIPGQVEEVVHHDLDHFQVKDRSGGVILEMTADQRNR